MDLRGTGFWFETHREWRDLQATLVDGKLTVRIEYTDAREQREDQRFQQMVDAL